MDGTTAAERWDAEHDLIEEGYRIAAGRDSTGKRWVEIEHVEDAGGYNTIARIILIEEGDIDQFVKRFQRAMSLALALPSIPGEHLCEYMP